MATLSKSPSAAPAGSRRWAGALLAIRAAALAGILLLPFFRSLPQTEEDFVYGYAAARMYRQGRSPYDRRQFQAELEALLDRPNEYVSLLYASAYPPAALSLWAPLTALPYSQAYLLWNLLLLGSAVLCLASACRLLGVSPASSQSWLLALALMSLPGMRQSILFHRLALAVLGFFLAGLADWKEGRYPRACFFWGFLAAQPHCFVFLAACLLLAGRLRQCLAMSWLFALQALPYALGLHPWSQWSQWADSLASHSSTLAFLDNQGLAMCLYKLARLAAPGVEALAPVFRPSRALSLLGVGTALAGWAVMGLLALGRAPLLARLAAAPALAIVSSPYSHGGDQLWILPFMLWVWARLEEAAVPLWPVLTGFVLLNGLALPTNLYLNRDYWGWIGYWSCGYLLLAGAVWLGRARLCSAAAALRSEARRSALVRHGRAVALWALGAGWLADFLWG